MIHKRVWREIKGGYVRKRREVGRVQGMREMGRVVGRSLGRLLRKQLLKLLGGMLLWGALRCMGRGVNREGICTGIENIESLIQVGVVNGSMVTRRMKRGFFGSWLFFLWLFFL